jgi:hypothetical protein
MALVVRAFPIRCARADVQGLADELRARPDETRRFFERFRVKREAWFLQTNDDQSYVIGVTEVGDPLDEVAQDFATTDDAFAQWFQGRVLEMSGVDERQQPLGPETAQVFDSTDSGFHLDGALAVRMYPLRSVKALRDFASQLAERPHETRNFYDAHDVNETWFVQETKQGPFAIAVASMHGDVEHTAKSYADSEEPFTLWFKQRVYDVSGVDPNETPLGPESEKVFEFVS